MKITKHAEICTTSNGYSICIMMGTTMLYGFECAGSAVKFTYTVAALRDLKIKHIVCIGMVNEYVLDDFRAEGFTVTRS